MIRAYISTNFKLTEDQKKEFEELNKKTTINCAETLKEYCKKREGCFGCLFAKGKKDAPALECVLWGDCPPSKWEIPEAKEKEILTKEEKEYLSALIKPYRKRVEWITKITTYDNKDHWISIDFFDGDSIELPIIEEEDEYKFYGMKADKKYELEDLKL